MKGVNVLKMRVVYNLCAYFEKTTDFVIDGIKDSKLHLDLCRDYTTKPS
jgi:hypothetical protein